MKHFAIGGMISSVLFGLMQYGMGNMLGVKLLAGWFLVCASFLVVSYVRTKK